MFSEYCKQCKNHALKLTVTPSKYVIICSTIKMNEFLCWTDLPSGPHTYRLEDLAYTRSGDKGNSANIGIFLSFAF